MNIFRVNDIVNSLKFILKNIINKSEEDFNNKQYIIVPDQFTSQVQEALLELSVKKAFINIEVLSFSAICKNILMETFNDKAILTELENELLIRKVLLEENTKFSVFKGKFDNNGFINDFKKLIADTEGAENILSASSFDIENKLLQGKLSDLKIFLKKYKKELPENVSSKDNILTNSIIHLSDWKKYLVNKYNGISFYFINFSFFTRVQYDFIEEILKNFDDVNFCFYDFNSAFSTDIFSCIENTIAKLKDMAKKNLIIVNEEVYKKEIVSYFEYFAKNIYTYKELNRRTDLIEIFGEKNFFSEISQVCVKIKKLVENNEYKFKDIIVFVGNAHENIEVVEKYFKRYGINYYSDIKKTMTYNPLKKFFQSISDIILYGKKTNNVIKLIKYGLFHNNFKEISKLENLILAKSKNYYVPIEDENLNHLIYKLNYVLKEIEGLKKCKNINDICETYLKIFNELNVEEYLKNQSIILDEENKNILSQQYKQLFDEAKDILNSCKLAFINTEIKHDFILKVLINIFNNMNLSTIPQNIDEVLLADPIHTMFTSKKVGFMIGVNANSFIPEIKTDIIFSKNDLIELSKLQVQFNTAFIDFDIDNKLKLVFSISRIKERLYISYSKYDINGNELEEDHIVNRAKLISNNISVLTKKENNEIFDEYDCLDVLSKISQDEQLYRSLINNLASNNVFQSEAQILLRVLNDKKYSINRKDKDINYFSISRIERYNTCPFSYFAQYELKLNERPEYELKSLDLGNLRHFLMEGFFRKQIGRRDINFNSEFIYNSLLEIIKLENNSLYRINDQTSRYMIEAAINEAAKAIKYMVLSLNKSKMMVADVESEFSTLIKIAEKDVLFKGKIDRIDITLDGGLRFIDYKSSNKKFDLEDIKKGKQLQLPFYAYIGSDKKNRPIRLNDVYKSSIQNESLDVIHPVMLNYIDISNAKVKLEKDEDKNTVQKKFEKFYNGNILYLSDEVEIDKNDYVSFIAKNTKDFNNILENAKVKVEESINKIQDGKVEANPYKDACTFCPYGALCGYDIKDNKSYKKNDEVKDE